MRRAQETCAATVVIPAIAVSLLDGGLDEHEERP